MVTIRIGRGGLLAEGHADSNEACANITGQVMALAANLDELGVLKMADLTPGDVELRWRTDGTGGAVQQATVYAYRGLKRMSEERPEELQVSWMRERVRHRIRAARWRDKHKEEDDSHAV